MPPSTNNALEKLKLWFHAPYNSDKTYIVVVAPKRERQPLRPRLCSLTQQGEENLSLGALIDMRSTSRSDRLVAVLPLVATTAR
jgi:hypothetical protein